MKTHPDMKNKKRKKYHRWLWGNFRDKNRG
jgi:hypothetical protein